MKVPLRYTIPLEDVEEINIKLEVIARMIAFYESWVETHGEYEYVSEQIASLTNMQCEYMIAREYCLEGLKVGNTPRNAYVAIKKEFHSQFPYLKYPMEHKVTL